MSRLCQFAVVWGILLATGAHAAAPSDAATPGPVAEQPPVAIEGFRSAHFGMTETEIRKAIETDFRLSGAAVQAGDNKIQHTRLLGITVPTLVPDSGKATINYVFGYKSQRLIEVNVTWSTAIDPANKPGVLAQTGATLQGYFQGEAFAAGQTAVNAMMPNGSVLLFRGTDPAGHTVVLVLGGTVRQDAKDHTAQMTPTTLTLAYAVDPVHPDVFRLQKGTF